MELALKQASEAVPRELDREKHRQRLGENVYRQLYEAVAQEVMQLRVILQSVEAKEKERSWIHNQTQGELDDNKLVDGVSGELAIFKRRGVQQPLFGSVSCCFCLAMLLSPSSLHCAATISDSFLSPHHPRDSLAASSTSEETSVRDGCQSIHVHLQFSGSTLGSHGRGLCSDHGILPWLPAQVRLQYRGPGWRGHGHPVCGVRETTEIRTRTTSSRGTDLLESEQHCERGSHSVRGSLGDPGRAGGAWR